MCLGVTHRLVGLAAGATVLGLPYASRSLEGVGGIGGIARDAVASVAAADQRVAVAWGLSGFLAAAGYLAACQLGSLAPDIDEAHSEISRGRPFRLALPSSLRPRGLAGSILAAAVDLMLGLVNLAVGALAGAASWAASSVGGGHRHLWHSVFPGLFLLEAVFLGAAGAVGHGALLLGAWPVLGWAGAHLVAPLASAIVGTFHVAAFGFGTGIVSHLLADMLNPEGIPLAWLPGREIRIRLPLFGTGSVGERVFALLMGGWLIGLTVAAVEGAGLFA